jgi:hypothetical protein
MVEDEDARNSRRITPSPGAVDRAPQSAADDRGLAFTSILDERIANLREAIEEIDLALAGRKELNQAFLEQIDREAESVRGQINMLQDPWKLGFHPQIEFLRLSLHKSLTSRAHDRRAEELKYWENGVNLAKERRRFLDEYKALVATRRRLGGG